MTLSMKHTFFFNEDVSMKISKLEAIDKVLEINKSLRAALSHDFLSPRNNNTEIHNVSVGLEPEKDNKLVEWKECLEFQHFVLTEMSSIVDFLDTVSCSTQDANLKYDKQMAINMTITKLAKVDAIVSEYSRLAHQKALQTNKRNPNEFYSLLASAILKEFDENNYTLTLRSQTILSSCSSQLNELKNQIGNYSTSSEREVFFRNELVDYLQCLSNLLTATIEYYKNNLLLDDRTEKSVLTFLRVGRN